MRLIYPDHHNQIIRIIEDIGAGDPVSYVDFLVYTEQLSIKHSSVMSVLDPFAGSSTIHPLLNRRQAIGNQGKAMGLFIFNLLMCFV